MSIRDIGRIINENSPGVVYHHIQQLERKGFLKRNLGNSKDYKLLDVPDRLIVFLNKYGNAQCGPEGFFLDDNVIEKIPISSNLLKFPAFEAFIVEAKGDSMYPKINQGDIVIGRKQNYASQNDIIVCAYEEKVLIKKFNIIGIQVFLSSENIKYANIPITEQDDFKIIGVVKNILNYY